MPVHESRNHRGDTLSNAVADICGGAFRAIYRLDRDTSGIVLIAKNEFAAAKLAGRVRKDYYAVVCGKIEGSGVIDAPIKRERESIIKRCVAGRTHQIRVHFAHIGYPLAGDTLYGGSTEEISRQALHCRDIYFSHPVSEEEIHIFCEMPQDMKKLIGEMV